MKRGQAAVEFLMTYGWAFLVIIKTIAALSYFGILDAKKTLPGRCYLGPEIGCKDFSISESSLSLKLTNNAGWPIIVDSIIVSNQNGNLNCQNPLVNVTWSSGSIKDVPVLCSAKLTQGEKEKLDVTISYHKAGSSNLFSTEVKGEVLSTVQGNATRDLSSNLKGQWNFNEGAGGIASDSSGNANQGSVNGPSWVAGIKGNALSFDGVDDKVEIADSQSLQIRSQITLIAWVNFHNTTGLADQNLIINKEGIPYEISIGDRGSPCFIDYANCPYKYRQYFNWYLGGIAGNDNAPEAEAGWKFGGGPVQADSWQQLALTYDGSAIKVYINSNIVGSYAINPQDIQISQTGLPLSIGGRFNFHPVPASGEAQPQGYSNFKGLIDEVKIYNISLTHSEIFADFIS